MKANFGKQIKASSIVYSITKYWNWEYVYVAMSKLKNSTCIYISEEKYKHWMIIPIILSYRLSNVLESNYKINVGLPRSKKVYFFVPLKDL